MKFYLGAPPPDLDAAAYLAAAQAGGDAWTNASLDGVHRCSNVQLTVTSVDAGTADVGLDYENRVIFRITDWSHDPSILALTSVFENTNTGEILDADVEVNAEGFLWADLISNPDAGASDTFDFQHAITHEFGHVLGLAHPCYAAGQIDPTTGQPASDPVDNNGNPAPLCSAATTQAADTPIMYPTVNLNSSQRRTLAPDDLQGVYDIYPYTANYVCIPLSAGGSSSSCSYSARPVHGGAGVGLLFVAALVRSWRRRR
jgi:hypothetical protein